MAPGYLYRATETQKNADSHASDKIPVFERAKTFRALDRANTVTGPA
jgi:hypothetical protein